MKHLSLGNLTKFGAELVKGLPHAAIEISEEGLYGLRESGGLVAGQWYRITDYCCTLKKQDNRTWEQTGYKSAGHQFDILVMVTGPETLCEECRAIWHEGDEYFANSNLAAWKVWYSFDAKGFYPAKPDAGKGYVYRMIDEWGTDLPCDFKNWQVLVCRTAPKEEYSEALSSLFTGVIFNDSGGYYAILSDVYDSFKIIRWLTRDTGDRKWAYYFSVLSGGDFADSSLQQHACCGNVVNERVNPMVNAVAALPLGTIFYGMAYNNRSSAATGGVFIVNGAGNEIGSSIGDCVLSGCYSTVGDASMAYLMNDSPYGGIIVANCDKAIINSYEVLAKEVINSSVSAPVCVKGTIRDSAVGVRLVSSGNVERCSLSGDSPVEDGYVIASGDIKRITGEGQLGYKAPPGKDDIPLRIGAGCYSIDFGEGCLGIIGDNCHSISFGAGCSVSIGDGCHDLSFGAGCRVAVGDNCSDSTFGAGCQDLTIGANSRRNVFGPGVRGGTGELCCLNQIGGGVYLNVGDGFFGNEICGTGDRNVDYEATLRPNQMLANMREFVAGDCVMYNRIRADVFNISMGDACLMNEVGTGDNVENYYQSVYSNNCVKFGCYCWNNKIGDGWVRIEISDYCCGNEIGKSCRYIYLGPYWLFNKVGDYCTCIGMNNSGDYYSGHNVVCCEIGSQMSLLGIACVASGYPEKCINVGSGSPAIPMDSSDLWPTNGTIHHVRIHSFRNTQMLQLKTPATAFSTVSAWVNIRKYGDSEKLWWDDGAEISNSPVLAKLSTTLTEITPAASVASGVSVMSLDEDAVESGRELRSLNGAGELDAVESGRELRSLNGAGELDAVESGRELRSLNGAGGLDAVGESELLSLEEAPVMRIPPMIRARMLASGVISEEEINGLDGAGGD